LSDKETVRRAIRQIDEGGSTNLHGGWEQGARTLAPHTTDGVTSRVILLSDGCANHGLTDPDAIYAECADLARAGVTTSTYGLGSSFNEELMIGMARHGQGSSYYGRTADDLMDPFHEEFALLNALCARRVRLEVATAPGVQATLLNDYVADDSGAWLLPNLAYGGEAWAVIRLRVRAPAYGLEVEARPLCSFAISYTTLNGELRTIQPEALALPAYPAAAFQAIAEDELVARRAGELEAAYLNTQARLAARRGDWGTVHAVLAKVERVAESNPWVAESLTELRTLAATEDEETFAKEAGYASRRMSTRLAERAEPAVARRWETTPAYLRRKVTQGKKEE
jgi:Ca-activated chloride channel family protein